MAQEVFEALLRSGKRFREPEHLRAWLLRVTVNKCKNLYRAKRRTEVPLTEAIPAPEAAEPLRPGRGARPARALPQYPLPPLL